MAPSRAVTTLVVLGLALAGAGWSSPASAAPEASTTTLTLSNPQSAYGQTVTASAQVVTTGTADGDVVFTVGGTTVKANLSGGGSASIVLPRATAVGEHAVSARFVPRLSGQEPSTSPTVTWVVSQVRTRLQVRVAGRGERVRTSVVGTAAGEYGTVPTGKVRIKVRRDGSGRWTKVVQPLGASGTVTAGLGRLDGGRYRLEVTYLGDSQHLRERYVDRFTVRGG